MIIQSIVNKAYISEMDLLRLQKALLICRMAADSTFLVDMKWLLLKPLTGRLEIRIIETATCQWNVMFMCS